MSLKMERVCELAIDAISEVTLLIYLFHCYRV
jgi:hypothetical protein